MMQGDGKGIAMRPEHRKNAGKTDSARPGIKKMAEIVAIHRLHPGDCREPKETSPPPPAAGAPPARKPRDKWVSASVTENIEDMIAAAFDEADRRDPEHVRQRVFLVDGNEQQLRRHRGPGGGAEPEGPGPHRLHPRQRLPRQGRRRPAPRQPVAGGQWADGQLLRVLHGRAKAVAATLSSVSRKARAHPRTRHLDLADVDRAVTYLDNNRQHMKYDKALAAGWPIATE